MDLFLAGEIDATIESYFFELRKNVKQKLNFLKEKDYGSGCNNIAIITMILKPLDNGCLMYKERRLILRKTNGADIRLNIDYNNFMNSNENQKYLLYCKNIIESLKVVRDRCKNNFRGQELIDDVMLALGVTKSNE